MNDPELQFWAANSNFDQKWWEKYFTPVVHPWKCLLDRGAFHQFPRALEGLVRVVLKRELDKTVRDEMKGVHWHDLPTDKQQRVIDYCLEDVNSEAELLDKLGPMSPIEEELAAHTRRLNRRGLHINADKVERDIGFLEQLRFEAVNRIPWVAADEAPLSYQQFARHCEIAGVKPPLSLDKRDLRCQAWIEENPKLGQIITDMRTFRGMNTKLEKLKTILNNADEDNIIPLDLLYCGARHTRRWSSKNINVQNLDSKPVFVEEMAELDYFKQHPEEEPGIFMRGYIVPPPGKKFGILDFSQIEPRCLNWIVGNETMLAAIRAGYGVYEAHALATMKWRGEPGTLKHTNPALYKFAKIRVLALGYGMGWNKFQAGAALPPSAGGIGVSLSNEEAQAQVNSFRKDNPKIVQQWKDFDKLIRSAAYDKEKLLELTMPTGDVLRHFTVRGRGKGMGFESYTIKGDFSQMSHQPSLWGGTLTENVTQRMARDILAESILRLEKSGFPLAFHAHDEGVLILDAVTAQKDFEEARRIMAVPPEWCADLPIAVDGAVVEHYTKLN